MLPPEPDTEPLTRRPRHLWSQGSLIPVLWLLLLVAAITLLTAFYLAQTSAVASLKTTALHHMARFTSAVDGYLAKHEYLPPLLADNPAIRDFLEYGRPDKDNLISKYLARINRTAGTLDVYLLNNQARTVASSNWNKPRSFIGMNYSFRPYYEQARAGRLGQYYALGTESNERGYYFSQAVTGSFGEQVGIVVVKASIEAIEAEWRREPFEFLITDPDGVIFIASHSEWVMHTLSPLSTRTLETLKHNRRYADATFVALDNFATLQLDQDFYKAELAGHTYLLTNRLMPKQNWYVHLLLNWDAVTRTTRLVMIITTLLLGLSSLLVLLLLRNHQNRRRYEQQAMEQLETKVGERTLELRRTQEELVQAAKMAALGQLSTAINHELNNPLGAIRSYADNARQFLELGHTDMTAANLQEITALTERMAAITHQLKAFARKSQGQLEPCNLDQALDAALLIMQPRLSRSPVTLEQQRLPDPPLILADRVWLEQILVNLLSNALEAVSEMPAGVIRLTVTRQSDTLAIVIGDNGPGIRAENMQHLFEAFFTTKASGKGLGLGLSISYRLARDMQGDLVAANCPQGGACFTLSLRVTKPDPADSLSAAPITGAS
ncbi:MAG: sensor histidine kinase [Thiothrix sp.]|nr:sensor histidine kinase [Thiothrix sp.]HPQ94821.1 ATP-binding protein [Thiolinea sp.]